MDFSLEVEHSIEGSLVKLSCGSQKAVTFKAISAIFSDLGINIVSFGTDRAPVGHGQPGKKHLQAFRGSFLVTDDDGERLGDALVDSLVEALQRELHLTPNTSSNIRKSDSISSNLSNASMSLDRPSGAPESAPSLDSNSSRQPIQGSPSYDPQQGGMPYRHHSDHHTDSLLLHTALLHAHHQRLASGFSTGTDGGHDDTLVFDRIDSSQSDALQSVFASSRHPSNSGTVPQPLDVSGSQQHCESLCSPAGGTPGAGTPGGPGTSSSQLSAASSVPGSCGPRPFPPPPGLLSGQLGMRAEDALEVAAGQQSVDSIMTGPVHSIHQDADLVAAKQLMSNMGVGALLVDTGTPVPGFLTKRDFLKVSFSKTLKNARVRDVMTQPVICINSGTTLVDAAKLIAAKGVRRVLVYDASRCAPDDHLAPYIGLIGDEDIFRMSGRCEPGAALRELLAQSHAQGGGGGGGGGSGPSQGGPLSPGGDRTHSGAGPHPYPSHMSSMSVGSLAYSISSLSEQAKNLSTEDRYRAAAALWELDFNEIEVTRKIGEGSFGEVVLGNFRGTKVAVKRMRGFELPAEDEPGPSPTMMPVFAQVFEREIEIMASIRHPNVVTFIGASHQPPNVCLVTEYCARGSLDHLLHKSGLHLDLVKKIEFGMDIARGMSCLHAQRPAIIHRDLKTANLLVSARFEVKVADFGLSRIKDHAHTHLTNSRAGLEGTVEYCAPEVLRGEPYTEKCDVWSYGVVLWELINRQRPYADCDVPIYILMMNLGAGTMSLQPLREEVCTGGLVRLVERCLAWTPPERPSFREILHALENEYKVVRGKAAAVPRSDSASSMVVLASHMHHTESAAEPAMQAMQQAGKAGSPSPHHPSPLHAPRPAPVVSRPATGAPPVRGIGKSGDGTGHDGHAHLSRFAQGPRQGHGVSGSGVSPGGTGPSVTFAPAHQAGGHHSAASGTPNPGSGGKQGRPPRPPRMSRARSTPLPANSWFPDTSDSWEEDPSATPSPPGLSDSGAVGQLPEPSAASFPVGLVTDVRQVMQQHPTSLYPHLPVISRLANIPEVGSWNDERVGDSGSNSLADIASRPSGGSANEAGSSLPSGAASPDPRTAAAHAAHSSPFSSQTQQVPFSSPFDGFLPFTDEASPPLTPHMQSAGLGPAGEADAAAAGEAISTPPAPGGVFAAAGQAGSRESIAAYAAQHSSISGLVGASPSSSAGLLLSNNTSPFHVYNQSPAYLPEPIQPLNAYDQPASIQPAGSASGGKTGSFFSPFASLPAFGDTELPGPASGLEEGPGQEEEGAGFGSLGAVHVQSCGVEPAQAASVLLVSSLHNSRADSGVLTNAIQGQTATTMHVMSTSMSMCLSMDASSPASTFDTDSLPPIITTVSAGGAAQSASARVGRLSTGLAVTPRGGGGGGGGDGPSQPQHMITRRSSFSPGAVISGRFQLHPDAFGSTSAACSPGPHHGPGSGNGRHSFDPSKSLSGKGLAGGPTPSNTPSAQQQPSGTPPAGSGPGSNEDEEGVTVHQVAWVTV